LVGTKLTMFKPFRELLTVVLRVRSLYFPDPERCPDGSSAAHRVEGGNLLEFVCYDASVG